MAITGVFTLCAVIYLMRAWHSPTPLTRFAGILHVLMAVAMIAMVWPWGAQVAPIVSVLVFSGGALFFAHRVVVDADATRRHLLVGSYDAAMMASMVLMSVLMSVPATANSTSAEANSAQGSMPGMGSMSAMGVPGTAGWAQPTGVAVLAALCAAAYFAAALWWFYALIRGPARPWGEVLMATGMGVAFAVLM
ncbi:DUF5134 domain-containing protein [Gordonia polyisoprenivorans]|uniref:DUF5134 domain-containing protein n=1 Tax=Gordonia polyisoprenivorans TaxID=84595 RepID=UPI0030CD3F6B